MSKHQPRAGDQVALIVKNLNAAALGHEHGRQDQKTCQEGDGDVGSRYIGCRPGYVLLAVQIGSIGDERANAQGEGEEGLPHSVQNQPRADLGEVRLQVESQPLTTSFLEYHETRS